MLPLYDQNKSQHRRSQTLQRWLQSVACRRNLSVFAESQFVNDGKQKILQAHTLTAFNRLRTPPMTPWIHGTGITEPASFTSVRMVILGLMIAVSSLDSRSEVTKSRSWANRAFEDWTV
jgi:hypothetical protein